MCWAKQWMQVATSGVSFLDHSKSDVCSKTIWPSIPRVRDDKGLLKPLAGGSSPKSMYAPDSMSLILSTLEGVSLGPLVSPLQPCLLKVPCLSPLTWVGLPLLKSSGCQFGMLPWFSSLSSSVCWSSSHSGGKHEVAIAFSSVFWMSKSSLPLRSHIVWQKVCSGLCQCSTLDQENSGSWQTCHSAFREACINHTLDCHISLSQKKCLWWQ